MMDNSAFAPKISVIVPVYNCEAYVGRCLESILAQDYRNIEVIVIDDGSTDSSSGICREYAAMDERVVLIRQVNGGLSAARNTGLNRATGDYVTFVDGDDYIDCQMLSQYVHYLGTSPNAIVIAGHREVLNGEVISENRMKYCRLSQDDALEELYKDYTFRNFMWNKIYKRSMFNSIRFPVGKAYEDLQIQYKLFENNEEFIISPFCGYNYVQRYRSISHTKTLSNEFDFMEGQLERFDSARIRKPAHIRLLALSIFRSYVNLIKCSLVNKTQRDVFHKRRRILDRRLRSIAKELKPYLGYRYRVMSLGWIGMLSTDFLVGALLAGNKLRSRFHWKISTIC